MDFQRSGIQPSKKRKIEDDVKQDDLEAAACGDDMWKEAPEDMLLEIFTRLPDSRSAILTAAVCHRWHSVISRSPLFVSRFTILFSPQYYPPICKLFSEEEDTSPNFLDFIMPCSPMVIQGSCNDLLLVSPGSRGSTQLYICNPTTKQYIHLPEIPRRPPRPYNYYHDFVDDNVYGLALVCMPGPSTKFRFKVVGLKKPRRSRPGSDNMVQPIMLYCSESRKWETRSFNYPRPTKNYDIDWLHGVACSGILYWLEFKHYGANRRVIYLDLSNDHFGAIDFPDDSRHGTCRARDQIGVVRVRGGEEFRLLQVILTTSRKSTVDLKVWKLSDKKEWVLVHSKDKLEKPNPKSYQALPFVHPTNGDVVFMVWGRKVFQYNLKDTNASTYELMDTLERPMANCLVRQVAPHDQLFQFPVVHTFWPTNILTS